MAQDDTKVAVKAAAKALQDFQFFCENCFWIRDKKGNQTLLKLNRAQKELCRVIQDQTDAGKAIRVVILKARQLGMSTLIEAYILWRLLRRGNLNALELAHEKGDAARHILDITRFAVEHLPGWFQVVLGIKSKYFTKTEITFEHNYSSVSISSAESKEAGRSQTLHLLHLSEAAFYPDTDTLLKSLLAAVPKSAISAVFIESTGNGPCYDSETEVFTKRGFINFSELCHDDYVLTRREDGSSYWCLPQAIIKSHFKGSLLKFESHAVDLLVTPNHKMYVKLQKGKYKLIEAEKLLGRKTDIYFRKDVQLEESSDREYFAVPGCTYRHIAGHTGDVVEKYIGPANIPMDLWLKFLGLYLSEGSVVAKPEKNMRFVRITQKPGVTYKGDVLGEIIDTCNKLGAYFSSYQRHEGKTFARVKDNGSGCKVVVITNKQLVQYLASTGKRIPRDILGLPRHRLEILYHAWWLGDGDSRGRIYTGIYRALADDVQELCLRLGYVSNIYPHNPSENRANQDWVVTAGVEKNHCYSTYARTRSGKVSPGRSIEHVPYDGYVYCCTVETGVLYVRRNGKCVWCGNSGYFYDTFDRASRGLNDYVELFFAWYWDDSYRMTVPAGYKVECPDSLRDLYESGEIDDEQLFWRQWVIDNDYNGDEDAFAQEFPLSVEEAFIREAATVFNPHLVYARKHQVEDIHPETGYLRQEQEFAPVLFMPDKQGILSIYERPVPGRPYAIGADVGSGIVINRTGDFSCADVLDIITGKQVAHLHYLVEPASFADDLYLLGKWFNGALVAIEVTGGHGLSTATALRDKGYMSIYQRKIYDKVKKQDVHKIGFDTTPRTKKMVIDNLRADLKNNGIIIMHKPSLDEMLTFVKTSSDKMGAVAGAKDDRVISLAITAQIRREAAVYTPGVAVAMQDAQGQPLVTAAKPEPLIKRRRIINERDKIEGLGVYG